LRNSPANARAWRAAVGGRNQPSGAPLCAAERSRSEMERVGASPFRIAERALTATGRCGIPRRVAAVVAAIARGSRRGARLMEAAVSDGRRRSAPGESLRSGRGDGGGGSAPSRSAPQHMWERRAARWPSPAPVRGDEASQSHRCAAAGQRSDMAHKINPISVDDRRVSANVCVQRRSDRCMAREGNWCRAIAGERVRTTAPHGCDR